jgi:hypothetical protein
MKIVREHINEKFTEDSDPIEDLGIGIKSKLEKYLKTIGLSEAEDKTIVLDELMRLKKYNYADFLLKSGVVDVNAKHRKHKRDYGFILRNAAYRKDWKGTKFLIERGANLEKTIERTSKDCPESLRNLIKLKNEILKQKTKKINEKFAEDSDPIHDLGIGNEFVRAKVGDIIKIKKMIYISIGKPHRIHFKETPQTTQRANGYIGVIVDIKHNTKGDKLTLTLIPYNNIGSARRLKERILIGRYIYDKVEPGYYVLQGTGTYEEWADHFKIVE